MARNYAALPHEYLEELDALNDAEFGRLTRALLAYSMTGEPIALCGNERFYAKRVMAQEDRFKASYEDVSSIRSEAGKAGAAVRWQNSKRIFANGKNGKDSAANGKNGYTETDTETKTETDCRENAATAAQKSAAAVPSVAEVQDYCEKFGFHVDAAEFVSVYSEAGWTYRGEPIRDWRALVRGWARIKAKDEAEEGDIFD